MRKSLLKHARVQKHHASCSSCTAVRTYATALQKLGAKKMRLELGAKPLKKIHTSITYPLRTATQRASGYKFQDYTVLTLSVQSGAHGAKFSLGHTPGLTYIFYRLALNNTLVRYTRSSFLALSDAQSIPYIPQ